MGDHGYCKNRKFYGNSSGPHNLHDIQASDFDTCGDAKREGGRSRARMAIAAGRLAIASAMVGAVAPSAHASEFQMDLTLAPPDELRMVVAGDIYKGSGVNKDGDCDAALSQAVDEVGRKGGVLVAYVDNDASPVTNAYCSVNDKNKATVKVRGVSVVESTSDDAPTISSGRALEIVQAFYKHPPPTPLAVGSALFNLFEIDGHYFLDAGSYSIGNQTFPFGMAGADRGSRVFWEALQPILPRIFASINAVEEVDGAEYVVTDSYIRAATDQGPTIEGWRFFFMEDVLGQYVAGLIGSQALMDHTKVMYTPKTSSNAWTATSLKVGDVPL